MGHVHERCSRPRWNHSARGLRDRPHLIYTSAARVLAKYQLLAGRPALRRRLNGDNPFATTTPYLTWSSRFCDVLFVVPWDGTSRQDPRAMVCAHHRLVPRSLYLF